MSPPLRLAPFLVTLNLVQKVLKWRLEGFGKQKLATTRRLRLVVGLFLSVAEAKEKKIVAWEGFWHAPWSWFRSRSCCWLLLVFLTPSKAANR